MTNSVSKRLLLHIGMPKAGSTAIQQFIKTASESSYVAPPLQGFNHSALLLFDDQGWGRKFYTARHQLVEDDWHQTREAFLKQLRELPPGRYVMSAEALFDATEQTFVRSLGRALSSMFDDVDVLVYLRDQADHFASLVSQRIKSGQHDWQDILAVPESRYRYDDICDIWSSEFKVIVRDYGRYQEDVLSDFCPLIGAPVPERATRVNVSLPSDALSLLALINESIQPERERERRRIVAHLEKLDLRGRPYVLDADLIEEIRSRFKGSNHVVARRFLKNQELVTHS